MSLYCYPLMFLPTVITGPGEYLTRSGERVTVEQASTKHKFDCVGFYNDSKIAECWHHSGRILAGTTTDNDVVSRA